MNKYQVDEFGYPIDPKLRNLEIHLCDLAGSWRGSWGNVHRQEEIRKEYHATMTKLYSLGWWDGTLDVECELPENLMPEEYVRRHSRSSFDGNGLEKSMNRRCRK